MTIKEILDSIEVDRSTARVRIDGVWMSLSVLLLVARDWIARGQVLALFTVEGDAMHVQEVRDGELMELAQVAVKEGGQG